MVSHLRTSLWPLAILLWLAVTASGQTPPNLAGKWTLVPATGAPGASMGSAPPTLSAPGTMGSGWGSELSIAQDAKSLTVEYTYFHPREVQPPFVFKYPLDGSPSRNTVNLGRGPQTQISRASLEEGVIVITTTHSFTHPLDGQAMTSETRQVLSLESPTTLLVETTRSAVLGGKASTTKTTYRRN